MKSNYPSILRHSLALAAGAAFLAAGSAHADTIASSADVRVLTTDADNNQAGGALSLYNDGSNIQRTFLNFDLSSYSGDSITSDATLTLKAGIYGDSLTGVSVGTADSAWTQTGITWNNQPGITAISGATNPSGSSIADGTNITWTIPWYMVEKMATAGSGYNNGLGITSGVGSTQHFQSTGTGTAPTLEFSAATGAGSTWTGGNGNWTDTANWAGSTVAEGIGQAATISGGTAVDITMDANRSVGSLSFSGADHTISSGAGKLALNVVSGSPTISVEATRTATISAELVGLDGLTKTDSGKLVVSGTNTYTGATTVSGGTLALQSTYASSGFAISSGATLELNVDSGSRDLGSTTFSGTGTLTKTGAGSVVWAASSATFAMGSGSLIDVQEGSFTGGSNANEIWTNNLAGLNVASGASFNGVEANVRVDALTGAGTITSGYPGAGYEKFTFGVNGGSGTFSGTLDDSDSAPANFVKEGSGTQTLSGTLNYTGTTAVNGGRLILVDSAADWGSGAGGLTNNAELEYSVTSGTRANSGSHGGSGNLYKTGDGTQTLSGTLNYTGTTTVAGGTLNLQGSGGGGTDYNGGNININGASTLRVSGERYNFSGETFTLDGVGGGTIDAIASGAGGMVFMGNNTFATSGGAQNIISGTKNGAENQGFNLNGQTATFNVATGTDATSDLKVTGTIWNGGNVVKDGAGRMEISSTQEYSGTTTVTGGTLIVNGSIASSSMTTVQSGATLGGSGPVGALTVQSGGTHNAGNSPGIQTVASATYESGSIFAWDLDGNTTTQSGTAPYVFDQVTVTGALDIHSGAVFRVIQNTGLDFENGFWDTTQTWSNIFTYGSLTSGWASNTAVAVYNTSNVLQDVSSYGTFTITGTSLTWTAVPEPTSALAGLLLGAGMLRRRRRA